MALRSLRHEVVRSLQGRHHQLPSVGRGFASFRADEIDGPWIALRSIEALGRPAAMDQESASGLPDHLAREAF